MFDCRRCSDWGSGPRPSVPGRCLGIERGSCRLVLSLVVSDSVSTNERCPVLKRPPTATVEATATVGQ